MHVLSGFYRSCCCWTRVCRNRELTACLWYIPEARCRAHGTACYVTTSINHGCQASNSPLKKPAKTQRGFMSLCYKCVCCVCWGFEGTPRAANMAHRLHSTPPAYSHDSRVYCTMTHTHTHIYKGSTHSGKASNKILQLQTSNKI